ncbi:hypothetical protein VTI74DRAFT_7148 [Chaetomium olivicolor]
MGWADGGWMDGILSRFSSGLWVREQGNTAGASTENLAERRFRIQTAGQFCGCCDEEKPRLGIAYGDLMLCKPHHGRLRPSTTPRVDEPKSISLSRYEVRVELFGLGLRCGA